VGDESNENKDIEGINLEKIAWRESSLSRNQGRPIGVGLDAPSLRLAERAWAAVEKGGAGLTLVMDGIEAERLASLVWTDEAAVPTPSNVKVPGATLGGRGKRREQDEEGNPQPR